MKLTFYSLLIIAIITLTHATSLLKVTKNKKSKKSPGNSWDSGYQCDIQIAKGTASLVKEQSGGFWAAKVITPSNTIENLGWTFVLDGAPGANLAKVMTRDGTTSNYYFPYRYFTGSCSFTNPSGNKYITCFLRNDDAETYQIKVLLPYKTFGWYINDDEGNSIVNKLNSYITKHRNTVTAAKSAAVQAANLYITNKPLLDAASGTGSNMTTQINNLKAAQVTLKTQIDSLAATSATAQTSYDTLMSQAQQKQIELASVTHTITDLNGQKDQLEKTLTDLGTNGTASQTQIASLKTQVDASLAAWNADVLAIKAIAPERNADVDAANTQLLALSSTGVSTNLNKVRPN